MVAWLKTTILLQISLVQEKKTWCQTGYGKVSWALSPNASTHTCNSFIFHLTKFVATKQNNCLPAGSCWVLVRFTGFKVNTHEAGWNGNQKC